MEGMPGPEPKVFRVRTTNSLLYSGCLVAYFSIVLGIVLGTILTRILYLSTAKQPQVVFSILFSIAILVVSMTLIIRKNFTKARVEVQGNWITSYDAEGNEMLSDDLNSIAGLFESHFSARNNNGGAYTIYYHVLFLSGNLLTFNQFLENDFILQKKLKSRAQQRFERITWSDYKLLEIETKESRSRKAQSRPKETPREFWEKQVEEF